MNNWFRAFCLASRKYLCLKESHGRAESRKSSSSERERVCVRGVGSVSSRFKQFH